MCSLSRLFGLVCSGLFFLYRWWSLRQVGWSRKKRLDINKSKEIRLCIHERVKRGWESLGTGGEYYLTTQQETYDNVTCQTAVLHEFSNGMKSRPRSTYLHSLVSVRPFKLASSSLFLLLFDFFKNSFYFHLHQYHRHH